MPILKTTSTVELLVQCDSCGHNDRRCSDNTFHTIDLFRSAGWTFRYPDAACPQCQLPEKPAGRATIVRS